MTTLVDNFSTDSGQISVFTLPTVVAGSAGIVAGQLVMNAPGGSSINGIGVGENPWPIPGADLFVSVKLGTPTWDHPSGSANNYGPGIILDANNNLWFALGPGTSSTALTVNLFGFSAGVGHIFFQTGILSSVLPDAIGFGLVGNIVRTFLSFSGVWQEMPGGLTNIDVSSGYNFTAPHALDGWIPSIYWEIGGEQPATSIATQEIVYTQPFVDPVAITVPDVIGDTLAQATIDINDAGLTVGAVTYTFNSGVPINSVISQSPVGGTAATLGESVALNISTGLVPSVVNLSEDIAKATLIAAGFTVGIVSFGPSVLIIPGNVILQNPVAGTAAPPGAPVSIQISTGRGPIAVPDLIGLTQAQAVAALLNVGLVPGAIGSTASTTVANGIVISQNIGPGIPYPIFLAPGSIVAFVVSSGPPVTDTLFNYGPTVISQYANSPTLLQWLSNMNQYMDQSSNFANFLSYVWNVDSAVGFGLDIWGKIVNVSRLLRIPNLTPYVGFDIASESQPAQDWTPAGSNLTPYNNPPVGGAMYTGHNATEAYLLNDNAYRQLILAKAFANICSTTAPAINQILQNLYGAGQAYVLSTGVMAISYNFNFKPTPIQLAILTQSGVIPTPPAVAVSIVTP